MVWIKNRLFLLLGLMVMTTSMFANEDQFPKENWDETTKGLRYEVENAPEQETREFEIDDNNTSLETSPIVSYILIAILGILVLFVIVVAATKKSGNKKVDPNAFEDYALEEVIEDLQEHDLERNLRLALEQQDYRAAIRIYFLQILKDLESQGAIAWKRDKTNRDYLREMQSHTAINQFKSITRNYEYIWYGEMEMNSEEYHQIAPTFQEFLNSIQQVDEQ